MATLAYLPFNFFCWLSPLVTSLFGVMGWTITRQEPTEALSAEPAGVKQA